MYGNFLLGILHFVLVDKYVSSFLHPQELSFKMTCVVMSTAVTDFNLHGNSFQLVLSTNWWRSVCGFQSLNKLENKFDFT